MTDMTQVLDKEFVIPITLDPPREPRRKARYATGLFEPINDVTHRTFCGPNAIATLTGVPHSRIDKMLRRLRRGHRDSLGRKRRIKGTWPNEVLKVLELLGCRIRKLSAVPATLRQFCDDMQHVGPCLVEAPGHFLATDRGMAWKPHYRNYRIVRAWRVEAPEQPKYGPVPERKPREPKPAPDIRAVRAARVAARIKAWETKRKRAENALRKLRKQARYYEAAMTA